MGVRSMVGRTGLWGTDRSMSVRSMGDGQVYEFIDLPVPHRLNTHRPVRSTINLTLIDLSVPNRPYTHRPVRPP